MSGAARKSTLSRKTSNGRLGEGLKGPDVFKIFVLSLHAAKKSKSLNAKSFVPHILFAVHFVSAKEL